MAEITYTESSALRIFGLNLNDLSSKSPEEKLKVVRSKRKELLRTCHPDKKNAVDPGKISAVISGIINNEKTKDINLAYSFLENLYNPASESEFSRYFKKIHHSSPKTAFDSDLLESIESELNKLEVEFGVLKTDEERRQFADLNEKFIQLASNLSLEELLENYNPLLEEHQNRSLLPQLNLQLRKLVISMFGEEYLDDFTYREAMSIGRLWPVMAARKLMSPVKLIAFGICSLDLVLTTSLSHLYNSYIAPKFKSFWSEFNSIMDGSTKKTETEINLFLAKALGLKLLFSVMLFASLFVLGLLSTVFPAFPLVFLSMLCLPLLSKVFHYLACPINTIIRPLNNKTDFSLITLNAIVPFLSAAGAALLISGVIAMPSSALILPWVMISLSLIRLLSQASLVKSYYPGHRGLAVGFGIYFFINTITDFVNPFLMVNQTLAHFLDVLSDISILAMMNPFFPNLVKPSTDFLPLPKEQVSEQTKTTVLQHVKTARISHHFFNTGKDKDFVEKDQRTLGQKAASFFGGGDRTQASDLRKQSEKNEPVFS